MEFNKVRNTNWKNITVLEKWNFSSIIYAKTNCSLIITIANRISNVWLAFLKPIKTTFRNRLKIEQKWQHHRSWLLIFRSNISSRGQGLNTIAVYKEASRNHIALRSKMIKAEVLIVLSKCSIIWIDRQQVLSIEMWMKLLWLYEGESDRLIYCIGYFLARWQKKLGRQIYTERS